MEIEKDLGNQREIYQKDALLEQNTPENPIELFRDWYAAAEEDDAVHEANAMNIATVGVDGFPKNRMVLLKKFTWEGFIFYTNYQSEKGKAIEANPKVCLSFFWPGLERQIIIKGTANKIAPNLSDGYFESRPEGSKLGTWASNQSEVIPSRELLAERLATFAQKFSDHEIPRPKHWGGFIVIPKSIEFWQGRPNRMHDRLRYTIQPDFNWLKERLAP